MAVVTIPLKPVPSQSVTIPLAGQPCIIDIQLLGGRQYLSLSVNGVVICQNVLIVNRSAIIRAAYTGFIGEIAAIDTQGDETPNYTGWGSRWFLAFNSDV